MMQINPLIGVRNQIKGVFRVMKQIKVAITDETKAYLDEQAQKNGRNLSEEVRVRMEQSQVDDIFDAATKELGHDIMHLARMMTQRLETGKWARPAINWQNDSRLFEALKVGVESWLTRLAAQLDLKSLTNEALDPVTFGRATADAYAHLKPMLIKHTPGGDNMEGKR
jgi:predicted phage gp36 major capsid-like protein